MSVVAEMMKTAVAVESDLSLSVWSLLLLTGVYKGNELHMPLVDNVNAKNTNNADMPLSYITRFQRLDTKNRIKILQLG